MYKIDEYLEIVDYFIEYFQYHTSLESYSAVTNDGRIDDFLKKTYRVFFDRREALLKAYLESVGADKTKASYKVSYTDSDGSIKTIVGSPFKPGSFLYSLPIYESSSKLSTLGSLSFAGASRYYNLKKLEPRERVICFFVMVSGDLFGKEFLGLEVDFSTKGIRITQVGQRTYVEDDLIHILDTENTFLSNNLDYIKGYYNSVKDQVLKKVTHFFEVIAPDKTDFGYDVFDERAAFYTWIGELFLLLGRKNYVYLSSMTGETSYSDAMWTMGKSTIKNIIIEKNSHVALGKGLGFDLLVVKALLEYDSEGVSAQLTLTGKVDLSRINYSLTPF